MTYQAYSCKDCHEPLFWNPKVISQKTGKKIPLNNDGSYHYTTCAAASTGADPPQQQQQQPQQQQQTQILQKESVPGLTKDAPFQGANGISEAQQVVHRQIFARLDRIDEAIKHIARAVDGINAWFQSRPPPDENEQHKADAEARYDQDKEDGLI